MSSDNIVIRINDISKSYQIYDKPRDRLKQFVMPRLRRFTGQLPKQYFREFWSLKNISFEVKKGETIGIIGKNGAGKSTLLQILCGTITPSNGTIETKGRIAALLELGAGFNPEFTGRENVFLNASLLGLTKKETEARFHDIVSFADIDDFLEQPVKTYSSGMFVRLAFAIAVHIEPDILIIDEALSVGDIAFRNKCIAKIKELRENGTTLLFVSHDLSTLQMICDSVIWLDSGMIREFGDPVKVCQEYNVFMTGETEQEYFCDFIPQQNTGMARFTQFKLFPLSGESITYMVGEEIRFDFVLEALENLSKIVFAISIYRKDGDWLIGQTSREANVLWSEMAPGDVHKGSLALKPICLAPGEYNAACGAYSEDISLCYAMTEIMAPFSIRSKFPTWGKVVHPCKWIQDKKK
jgi:ABC-type polysaccharide/polyol phosphate transport system ATPase subunit